MVFEQIEQLKRSYTDKYVVVDESRPELQRFGGAVGRVKTVNMSGRALVEFGTDNNIGWYDIDPDFLKVVDRPPPQAAEARKRAKPAAAAKPSAAAAPGKPSGGKPSTADILAAARGGAKPAAGAKPSGKMSTSDILAAARGGTKSESAKTDPAKPAAKAERAKLSTADILAAARGKSVGDKPAGGESAAASPAKTPAEPPAAKAPPAPAAKSDGGEKVDRAQMTTADILAWCREHDG